MKELLWEIAVSPDLLRQEINRQHGKVETTIEDLDKELRHLAREKLQVTNDEVEILLEKIRGHYSADAVDSLLRQLHIRSEKIEADKTRVTSDLAKARAAKGATVTLSQVHYWLAKVL